MRRISGAFYRRTAVKAAIKRLLWVTCSGFVFKKIVARKDVFERHFKGNRRSPSITLNPTNLCNALCSFCAYPTNTDKKQMMPNSIAFKAIDDFIAMGGTHADFTPNLGDPLIDPLLCDKVAYAKSKGMHTRFYTNGILLDRDGLIEKIAPYLDELRISLPGLDRKNYFDVYKVDKAQKVTRGLLRLAEYKKRTGTPQKVHLDLRISRPLDVVLKDEGMLKLKPYLEQGILEIDSIRDTFDSWSGALAETEFIGNMSVRDYSVEKPIPCAELFVNPGVMPDGHVRACSSWYVKTNYDKLTLENLVDKQLDEIIYGDKHRSIFTDWLRGELPPPCPKCSSYEPIWFSLSETVGMVKSLMA